MSLKIFHKPGYGRRFQKVNAMQQQPTEPMPENIPADQPAPPAAEPAPSQPAPDTETGDQEGGDDSDSRE